jgi:carbamate kinase
MLDGAVCVSNIKLADLGQILTLAGQGGLPIELEGQKQTVQGVADRLCAWESELATEAKATKAR